MPTVNWQHRSGCGLHQRAGLQSDNIIRLWPLRLQNMVDSVSAIIDSLENLGKSEDIMNALVIHLVLSKVDCDSKAKWDEQLDYANLPK